MKTDKKPPVTFENHSADVVVTYRELGGVKTIPVKMNGITMEMIFDTGCSGMHMSKLELLSLAKNNKISHSDYVGEAVSTIADGSSVQNSVFRISEVEIEGDNGTSLKLTDVDATVDDNLSAPLLLGNGVLDDVAQYQIDNVRKTITFKKR